MVGARSLPKLQGGLTTCADLIVAYRAGRRAVLEYRDLREALHGDLVAFGDGTWENCAFGVYMDGDRVYTFDTAFGRAGLMRVRHLLQQGMAFVGGVRLG